MKKKLALEFICALFILLFTYAAGMKLTDVQKFTVQISQSPILENYAGFVAWAIPILELVIAVMLVMARFRLMALYAAFTLMTMFTLYIIAILQFSYKIPCSCGGILESMGWTEHLIFNIGFVLLAIAGIALYYNTEERNTPAIA
ncbi:MauE/DoxX family redox-associated membrane protein [Fulvivirgaceae bacterium BMA12]|uniref:MauE/DoxX family redox-associated membrane protein n=1 Tax=Agaribacillus aureus TaxID=3051825 RepID=A0ABT8L2I5_9BACT|nr:MauE/DoxX family redox-associated membrane protein [Fulvivirgaceae bacterium BMA12]